MATKAQRLAFGVCPETCPAVDKAFDVANWNLKTLFPDYAASTQGEEILAMLQEAVKSFGTVKLRCALEDMSERVLDYEDEVEDLKRQNDRLEHEVSDLRSEVKLLERQLDEVQA